MIIYQSKLAHLLLWKGYTTITLGPFILTKKAKSEVSATLLRHERIHVVQWCEVSALSILLFTLVALLTGYPKPIVLGIPLCFLVYYLIYAVEYAISRLHGNETQNEDYHRIEFEKEAYRHQGDPTYLAHRIPFNWLWKK